MSEKEETIHGRIKRLREGVGLSQEGLGKLCGVSWQSVQQWENEAGTAPTRKRQASVAKALNVTVDELMFGDPKRSSIKALADTAHDKLLGQLLDLYKDLDQKYRDKLLDSAQFYHSIQYPHVSTSNPLQGVSKKSRSRAKVKATVMD